LLETPSAVAEGHGAKATPLNEGSAFDFDAVFQDFAAGGKFGGETCCCGEKKRDIYNKIASFSKRLPRHTVRKSTP